MRTCTKCKIEKDDACFSNKSYWCKPCHALIAKERRLKIASGEHVPVKKSDINPGIKKCNKCGCEKKLEEFPKGRGAVCKICKQPMWRKKSQKNKEYYRRKAKERYEIKGDEIRAKRKEWNNKPEVKEAQYQKHKEREKTPKARAARNKQKKKKRDTNPQFRISNVLRGNTRRAVMAGGDKYRTYWLLQCTIEFFMKHIESLFQDGMSWDNYGYRGWHLEHRIPCFAFDMTNVEHQKRCFHWSNYRPMWGRENHQKNRFFDVKHLELWLNTPIEKLHELVDYDFKPITENELKTTNIAERREVASV